MRGSPAGTMEETYMEENRSLEPETLGPAAPGEENAPAAGAPEKRKLPGKKLVILAAAALAVIAAAARPRWPSATARSYSRTRRPWWP